MSYLTESFKFSLILGSILWKVEKLVMLKCRPETNFKCFDWTECLMFLGIKSPTVLQGRVPRIILSWKRRRHRKRLRTTRNPLPWMKTHINVFFVVLIIGGSLTNCKKNSSLLMNSLLYTKSKTISKEFYLVIAHFVKVAFNVFSLKLTMMKYPCSKYFSWPYLGKLWGQRSTPIVFSWTD